MNIDPASPAQLLVVLAAASLVVSCGARSDLSASGTTGGNPCTSGVCTTSPPACLGDEGPVTLATGLTDPYALGGDATSLFAGQLGQDLPLLRIPKVGGAAEVFVGHVSFADYLAVSEEGVFYSDEHALNTVPATGGAPTPLATAAGPAGFALTPDKAYLADYFGKQLIQIDRSTLETEVLKGDMDGIYRVAVTGDTVYFSTFSAGLFRYRLSNGGFDILAPALGAARAVLAIGEDVYYTVPKTQRVYRVSNGASEPELVGDLSALGTFPEALQTDGTFLYLTLATSDGDGLIVRLPLGGGEPEVVAPGGGPQPSALVVDEACVYWTERSSGSVLRARKP